MQKREAMESIFPGESLCHREVPDEIPTEPSIGIALQFIFTIMEPLSVTALLGTWHFSGLHIGGGEVKR